MRLLIALAVLFLGMCCAPTQLVTKADSKSAEPYVPRISLVGAIDEDSVAAALTALRAVAKEHPEAVVFEIDSPGGEVGAGLQLAKALEDYPVRLICVVDGDAASMAFYLLQSCPLRLMTKRSSLMMHRPYLVLNKSPDQIDDVDKANIEARMNVLAAAMFEHYAARMGSTPENLALKVPGKKMWWMGWSEGVCSNAVDGVVTSVPGVLTSLRSAGSLPEVTGCNLSK
jgi:ATP-dependent protease ClpP protease subunit